MPYSAEKIKSNMQQTLKSASHADPHNTSSIRPTIRPTTRLHPASELHSTRRPSSPDPQLIQLRASENRVRQQALRSLELPGAVAVSREEVSSARRCVRRYAARPPACVQKLRRRSSAYGLRPPPSKLSPAEDSPKTLVASCTRHEPSLSRPIKGEDVFTVFLNESTLWSETQRNDSG